MKSACVFCGSSAGKRESYTLTANSLGEALAKKEIQLVYGGASIGVMGAVADSVLSHDGKVIGVIPEKIVDLEVAHKNLSELLVVSDMHERKAKMYELSDIFIVLPGGFGTLDEMCEVLTWNQLAYHQKKCLLLNIDSYYDSFIKFVDHSVSEGFISAEHRKLLTVVSSIEELDRYLS